MFFLVITFFSFAVSVYRKVTPESYMANLIGTASVFFEYPSTLERSRLKSSYIQISFKR